MYSAESMDTHLNASGFVIAGIGFFLTRFSVTLAVYDDPVRFYVVGIVPLVLGLGLAAFGVALAVGDVEPALVLTTALWCVIGTGTMAVLVLLTLRGASAGGMPDLVAPRSRTYLANFLIGGSVGGTLTGLYAARNRLQRRDLRQQANRLEVLNRLLRHEILNSLTAIRGYASLSGEKGERAETVINERASAIEATIEQVKHLTNTAGPDADHGVPIALRPCLERSLASIREDHPAADVAAPREIPDVQILANERVEQVFTHLLENAVLHASADEPSVTVAVEPTPHSVRVSVTDEGPGLPAAERALLEEGQIGAFDDPTAGFGLNVVRLLVESYRGSIETGVDEAGTTVTVVLPRADDDGAGIRPSPTGLSRVRVSTPRLAVTVGAALLAGAIMGLATDALGSGVPVIGALYGVEDPVVGWITHEFHSVVFGFVFAGLVTAAPVRVRSSLGATVGIGVAWSVVLWAGAAGVVMPIWLTLVGLPTPIPTLALTPLLTHLLWGVSMGLLVSLGYEHAAPRLAGLD